jgi:hypothetical protein
MGDITESAASAMTNSSIMKQTSKSISHSIISADIFYENFLELLAQLTSLALTDDETERIATQLRKFHATLRRVSSRSMLSSSNRLNDLQTKSLSAWLSSPTTSPTQLIAPPVQLLCKHSGTCFQNSTRGWIRSFLVGYLIKYCVGTIPSIVTGKVFKKYVLNFSCIFQNAIVLIVQRN